MIIALCFDRYGIVTLLLLLCEKQSSSFRKHEIACLAWKDNTIEEILNDNVVDFDRIERCCDKNNLALAMTLKIKDMSINTVVEHRDHIIKLVYNEEYRSASTMKMEFEDEDGGRGHLFYFEYGSYVNIRLVDIITAYVIGELKIKPAGVKVFLLEKRDFITIDWKMDGVADILSTKMQELKKLIDFGKGVKIVIDGWRVCKVNRW